MPADDDPHEPPQPRRADRSAGAAATAIVLAAGRGTRMRSAAPKVLQPLAGRPLAGHVLHALAASGIGRAVVVTPGGARGEQIRAALGGCAPPNLDLAFAEQPEPTGTADAARAARTQVQSSELLLVNGDLGLLTERQIAPLLAASGRDALLATARAADPAAMGRIVRDAEGRVCAVVEAREASAEQLQIDEVNVGIYRFRSAWLWAALERRAGSRGERYATDVIADAAAAGSLTAVEVPLPEGRLNIETPADLAAAERSVRTRTLRRLEAGGAVIIDPASTWADVDAEAAAGAVIEPGSHLRGRTRIGAGARVGPNAILRDVELGANCALESCTISGSRLGARVAVGPYSTIRAGCVLGDDVQIGTHAELKNARLEAGVKVGHFSYLGDAEIGARANIGAGAITCNYDGEQKQRTRIGAEAFIGSDTLLIAPLEIGARARTGAGAVVTKDVPADGNAVGHPARLAPRAQRKRGGR